MRKAAFAFLALGLGGAAGWVLAAQDDTASARVTITPRAASRPLVRNNANIRVDTRLVLIPVTVTNTYGAPLQGLERQAFHLFEDGVEQQVKYFAAEDSPVSLGIVFDASRSMEGKLDQSRAAVSSFFRTSVAGDEFFLVEFSDAPRLATRFTPNTETIEKALVGITARNWTALLDAVYMAIHEMKHAANPRKALLVLSDGGDNNSRYTETEIKSRVREADVCIYSIGLGSGLAKHHVRLLKQLSEETGGQYGQAEKMTDLPDVVARMSAAIRHQYLLGYSSSNASKDGLYRKIQVRLQQPAEGPPLHASWRTGYYAPGE
jgi:Ca-activated chloride channel homolog